jgi:replicative DNA helicase
MNAQNANPCYRRPPHNLEAEQALLGAILVNNEALSRVSDFLQPQHFHDELHRSIFETAAKLIAEGKRADPITLKSLFAGREPIDANTTVPQYLGRLAANATTIINAGDYGRTIRELAARRQLILIGEDIANAAFASQLDFPVDEQIAEAEGRLYGLADSGKYGQGFSGFEDVSTASMAAAGAAKKSGGGITGIATRFTGIDAKMGGLHRSDLIVLAGRPSMGKTALATNIGANVAKGGKVVAFFSLEMSDEQLATRILSEQAGLQSERIRRGQLTDAEFDHLAQTQQRLAKMPLFIDQTGAISIAQLAARARRLKRQQKRLDLVIVDYLQLMTGSRRNRGNRVEEVSEITTGLKALAKELNAPVLALSQLNRAVENRDDKRPQLSDLRESGSIEQDADVVMFVFRKEYYLERTKPDPETERLKYQEWLADMQAVAGKAEVIIGKQRHGPIGIVTLQFEGTCTRFSNYAVSHQHQPNGAEPSHSAGPIYGAVRT